MNFIYVVFVQSVFGCISIQALSHNAAGTTIKKNVDYSTAKNISGPGGRALTSIGIQDGKEFYINAELGPVSFGLALDYCHAFNMNLAAIYTLNQQDWVWYHVPQGHDMWLAGSDLFREGSWTWWKNQDQFVFIRWALGQPLLTNTRNCLYLSEAGNEWISAECGTGAYHVLCELAI